jgi:type III secretory pathway component EscR
MSKDEIKYEISKVLDQFSDKALKDLLDFLRSVGNKQTVSLFNGNDLEKILTEDKDLLEKLAK